MRKVLLSLLLDRQRMPRLRTCSRSPSKKDANARMLALKSLQSLLHRLDTAKDRKEAQLPSTQHSFLMELLLKTDTLTPHP